MEQKPMMIGPSRLSNGRVGTSSQIGGMMRSINESSVERNKHGHESIPCPHTLSPLSLLLPRPIYAVHCYAGMGKVGN